MKFDSIKKGENGDILVVFTDAKGSPRVVRHKIGDEKVLKYSKEYVEKCKQKLEFCKEAVTESKKTRNFFKGVAVAVFTFLGMISSLNWMLDTWGAEIFEGLQQLVYVFGGALSIAAYNIIDIPASKDKRDAFEKAKSELKEATYTDYECQKAYEFCEMKIQEAAHQKDRNDYNKKVAEFDMLREELYKLKRGAEFIKFMKDNNVNKENAKKNDEQKEANDGKKERKGK